MTSKMVDSMHSHTGRMDVKDLEKVHLPGPGGKVVECYIKRDKNRFTLWHGPPPKAGAKEEECAFLLAALKSEHMEGFELVSEYIISSNLKLSKENRNIDDILGVVDCKFSRQSLLTARFTIRRRNRPHNAGAVPPIKTTTSGRDDSSKIFAPGVLDARYFNKVGDVTHELHWLGPGSIECSLLSPPTSVLGSAMDSNGSAPTPTERPTDTFNKDDSTPVLQGYFEDFRQWKSVELRDCAAPEYQSMSWNTRLKPLVLSSKSHRWDHIMKFFPREGVNVVEFRKNQQPVFAAVLKPNKDLLQIAKCDTWDLYTVRYRYPLSTFQAFAVSLTIFGR